MACWRIQLTAPVNPLAGLLDAVTVAEDEISDDQRNAVSSDLIIFHLAFGFFHLAISRIPVRMASCYFVDRIFDLEMENDHEITLTNGHEQTTGIEFWARPINTWAHWDRLHWTMQ